VLAWFRASKVGSEALMQGEQSQRPCSYLLQRWSCFLRCDMVIKLHAFLVSDGHLLKDFSFFVACHIEIEKCMKSFLSADMDQFKSATVVYCALLEDALDWLAGSVAGRPQRV
jgi:hypothetical protein